VKRGALVLAALVLVGAAAPAGASLLDLLRVKPWTGPYTLDMTGEVREPNRLDLDAAGQRNCVASAREGGTPACPPTATNAKLPVAGVLMLDATYFAPGPTEPKSAVESFVEQPTTQSGMLIAEPTRGTNPHRATGGLAPDVVWPGIGHFRAWYGRWNDTDGDGRVRVSGAAQSNPPPDNEWVGVADAPLVAFIEPGSRPAVTSTSRPAPYEPDIVFAYDFMSASYAPAADGFAQFDASPVIFPDGSLLRSLRSVVVSNPVFAPSEDGALPMKPHPASFVDIDVYPAAAPAPVALLYGSTLAPLVDAFGSPSLGLCPAACRPGPEAAAGTPLEPLAGPAAASLYAAYEIEHAPGSGASRAGRHAEHLDAWAPWLDLRILQAAGSGPFAALAGPLSGRTADGRMTALPGTHLVIEAWTGAWRDLDGNGRVGRAGDPYASGARPFGDDYLASGGEFVPFRPVSSPSSTETLRSFPVRIAPDGDWEGGVLLLDELGMPICGGVGSMPGANCANGVLATGGTVITIPLSHRPTEEGRHVARYTLFLPAGSPGLEACAGPVHVRYGAGISAFAEDVSDCDRLARVDAV